MEVYTNFNETVLGRFPYEWPGNEGKGNHMAVNVDMKALLEAGAHFGHKTSRWHPKMAPYIHSKRQEMHIINLEKTVEGLEKALPKLTEIAKSGKKIANKNI